jgi:phenylacetate-CoA ligase
MIIRGVNVFPSQIEELILKQPDLAPHYVLELTRDGSLDRLTVRVESGPGTAVDDTSHAAGRQLEHHIKSYIGITAAVVVCDPGSIERSVGKAKRVIDRRAEARA